MHFEHIIYALDLGMSHLILLKDSRNEKNLTVENTYERFSLFLTTTVTMLFPWSIDTEREMSLLSAGQPHVLEF